MLLDHDVHLFDKSCLVVMHPRLRRSGMFCVVEVRGRKEEERVGKERWRGGGGSERVDGGQKRKGEE